MSKILLVDDEESIRVTIGEFIREMGQEVHTAKDVTEAFELLKKQNFDVIVTDIIMPKITGIELLRQIHERSPDIPIVMMTGEPEVRSASEAVRAGAFDYLAKPISSDAIRKVIRNAVKTKTLNDEKKRLEEENRKYQEHLEELVEERTQEVRESEKKYRLLFEESIDAIYLTNLDGTMIDCNPALLELFGYTKKEMIGLNVRESYLNPKDRDGLRKQISENGFVKNFEVKLCRKDTTDIDCSINAVARRDNNGKIIGFQGIIRDITKRKRAEEEMQKLAAVVRHSNELVNLATLDGRMIFLNEAGCKMLGIEPHEMPNVNIMEVIPDHLKGLVEKELLPRLMMGEIWEGDLQYRNMKTGELTDVHAMTFTVKDSDTGVPQFLANVSLDITQRKQSEEALRESEEKLRNIFENSTNLFYSHTTDHQLTYLSPQVTEILGYTPEEAMIKWTELASDNPLNEKGFELTLKAIETGRPQPPYELELVHKSGRKVWVEIREAPVAEDGKTVSIVGAVTDITERKRMEESRKELDSMKSDFIILNAHELGTPLMIINGYLDTLKEFENHLDEDGKNAIQHIDMNLKRIEKLQKAMYNITLLELNKFSLNKTPLFMHHIAKKVLDELKIIAERKGISLVPSFPSYDTILADADRIHKVISILVDNAIKYTPEGGTIEISGAEDDRNIELTVKDNGIGIALKEQENIFKEFYQVENIMGHKDGFGLGLSLAKGIIESHGGDIRVESVPGKGSSFHIRIPKE